MVFKHLARCEESIFFHTLETGMLFRGHTMLRESLLLADMRCTSLTAALVGRGSWISTNLRTQPGLQSKF